MNNRLYWVDQTLKYAVLSGRGKNLPELLTGLSALGAACFDLSPAAAEQVMAVSSQPDASLRVTVTRQEDLLQVKAMGIEHVILICRYADAKLPDWIAACALTAKAAGIKVSLHLVNAGSHRVDEIRDCLLKLDLAQFESVIYGDEDSQALPLAVYQSLRELTALPVAWEFHGHNQHGLATANCLGSLRAGVERAALSVASLGHNGHPAFEEVMAAAKYILKLRIDLPEDLQQRCRDLCASLGFGLPGNKAVIGEDIFAHESGIHVDGVLKQPSLYEMFPPEAVGAERKLVIGKHSGSRSLTHVFDPQGITLTPREIKRLLRRVRDSVDKTKQPVSEGQLYAWYRELQQERCHYTSRCNLLAGGRAG